MSVVNDIRMTLGMMVRKANKIAGQRAARRLLALIAELQGEEREEFGVTEAARRVGIDQGYLSKLMSKERDSLGLSQTEAAAKKVGVDQAYFLGEEEPRSYHDFLRGRGGHSPVPQSLQDFLASPVARDIKPEHEEELRTTAHAKGDPGFESYVHLYNMIRARERHQIEAPSLRATTGFGHAAVIARAAPENASTLDFIARWHAAVDVGKAAGPMHPWVEEHLRAGATQHGRAKAVDDIDTAVAEQRAELEEQLRARLAPPDGRRGATGPSHAPPRPRGTGGAAPAGTASKAAGNGRRGGRSKR
jgi:transcriptional regulator with XRE-family HTH domain